MRLGTPDVSLYEMVGAYSAFANQGVYIKPSLITRIEDKNSTVYYFKIFQKLRDVLSEEAAYVTISLMEGVTQSGSGQSIEIRLGIKHSCLQGQYDYWIPLGIRQIPLQVKLVLLKTKVMDGLWGWFQI